MGDQSHSRAPQAGENEPRRRSPATEYDPLLPSQYYAGLVGSRATSGEFKLFYAILEDALRCYVRAKDCRSALRRAEFLDAQAWFNSRGTHLFSFESVCSFLGIDASWLRERLNQLTPTDFPLKQYRTRRHRPTRPSANRGSATKVAVDSACDIVGGTGDGAVTAADLPAESHAILEHPSVDTSPESASSPEDSSD